VSGKQTGRNMLKLTGASVTATGVAGVASGEPIYRGISYDTLTHRTGGVVSGTVSKDGESFSGEIRIAGFQLSLDELESIGEESPGMYSATYADQKRLRDGVPLQLNFEENNVGGDHHYSGYLTRPSGKFGKLGFYLTDDKDYRPQKALGLFEPDQKWEQYDLEVPDSGVPTDSSPHNLKDILPRDNAMNGSGA
jgi:hypothetical protein